MNLKVIHSGMFKLDGGAMFGVVPKVLWNKTNPADNNNLIDLAMRCLLVESDNKLILIDTGIGDKQSEKFFSHYYLHGDHSLKKSLNDNGLDFSDITDVFQTHLHFDHCGGSVKYDNEKLIPTFSNAKYWSHSNHWDWAVNPNQREKASFLKENILPIQESGQLYFTDDKNNPFTTFDYITVDGHTEKQMLPVLNYKGRKIVFTADLIPTSSHVPIPFVMGYDVRPLETLKEKSAFLEEAVDNDYILFLEHDPFVECCTLKRTEKGIRVDQTFKLDEI
ncbi:MBL fold metallo-hydrolase [Marinigracilibium pacificum]|uniref:MBL fold metallo-hydrolase n=1 Tax=Marinigracilibium pacificum TaxID=2729599 RepID=A0A848IXZ9_9BACT|nr:MBL fold metallo-hydrolase [Marinigracilibium pacificum]NMM48201.1 MBL fold metallo-hydrolase [Marinigracilibium pacificum]